jgi:hypothetical protein
MRWPGADRAVRAMKRGNARRAKGAGHPRRLGSTGNWKNPLHDGGRQPSLDGTSWITRESAALYCRVSTADQTCARQEKELRAFAKKAGYKIIGVWKETASGAKDERAERKRVLALAQARKIDVILVTELTRWGRSMLDLVHTLQDLQAWGAAAGSAGRGPADRSR